MKIIFFILLILLPLFYSFGQKKGVIKIHQADSGKTEIENIHKNFIEISLINYTRPKTLFAWKKDYNDFYPVYGIGVLGGIRRKITKKVFLSASSGFHHWDKMIADTLLSNGNTNMLQIRNMTFPIEISPRIHLFDLGRPRLIIGQYIGFTGNFGIHFLQTSFKYINPPSENISQKIYTRLISYSLGFLFSDKISFGSLSFSKIGNINYVYGTGGWHIPLKKKAIKE